MRHLIELKKIKGKHAISRGNTTDENIQEDRSCTMCDRRWSREPSANL